MYIFTSIAGQITQECKHMLSLFYDFNGMNIHPVLVRLN
jgi:hypothetical protein